MLVKSKKPRYPKRRKTTKYDRVAPPTEYQSYQNGQAKSGRMTWILYLVGCLSFVVLLRGCLPAHAAELNPAQGKPGAEAEPTPAPQLQIESPYSAMDAALLDRVRGD